MSSYLFETRQQEHSTGGEMFIHTYVILRWAPNVGTPQEVVKEYTGTHEPGSDAHLVSVECAKQRALAEEWRKLEKEKAELEHRFGRLSQLRARMPVVIP